MDLLSAILGGIVSLIINELLGHPVSRFINLCKRGLRIIKNTIIPPPPPPDDFLFGKKQTSVYLLESKGDSTGIDHNNIYINVNSDKSVKEGEMSAEIEYFCQQYDGSNDENGNWNGHPLSLYRYSISRTPGYESPVLSLTLLRNRYFLTKLIIQNKNVLCPITNRRMADYIDSYNFCRENIYELPNSIGVCFMVETNDGKLIFSRRDEHAGLRPGEWDVSVVEGLDETKDAFGGKVNIEAVFYRAINEELCSMKISEIYNGINILALVIDKEYGQWNFIGTVSCSLSEQEIMARRANGDVEDRWELIDLAFCKKNLKEIMTFLSSHKMWDMGLATVYYSLLAMGYSRERIDKAIMKYYREP